MITMMILINIESKWNTKAIEFSDHKPKHLIQREHNDQFTDWVIYTWKVKINITLQKSWAPCTYRSWTLDWTETIWFILEKWKQRSHYNKIEHPCTWRSLLQGLNENLANKPSVITSPSTKKWKTKPQQPWQMSNAN